MGRPFTQPEDKPGAPKVILLTYAAWQNRFGGADVLGHTLTINDAPNTVIGIMAPAFRLPGSNVEAITPLAFHTATQAIYFMQVTGRLRAGVSVTQAAAELQGFFAQVKAEQFFGEKPKLSVVRLQDRQVSNVR